jgi:hypothetical protein
VSGVAGLLNFAFPSETVYGPRGDVDDDICLTYCPSLYVVGQYAKDAKLKSIQKLRANSLCDSGLIIVGGANRNLYVNAMRLSTERVSQRFVERAILGHVIDFMRQVTQESGLSARDLRPNLHPVHLANIYEVDGNALKSAKTATVGGSGSAAAPPNGLPRKKHSIMQKPSAQPVGELQPLGAAPDVQKFRMRNVHNMPPMGYRPSLPPPPSFSGPQPQRPLENSPLFVARTTLDASLRSMQQAADPIRLPTPAALNQHLPPPMNAETIREEDAAAAALSLDVSRSLRNAFN